MNGINRAWVQETHRVNEIIQAIEIASKQAQFYHKSLSFHSQAS